MRVLADLPVDHGARRTLSPFMMRRVRRIGRNLRWQVSIAVPISDAWERCLTLPQRRLARLVELNLAAATSFQRDEVSFDFTAQPGEADGVLVRHFVVVRPNVSAAIDLFGDQLRGVDFIDLWEGEPSHVLGLDLLQHERGQHDGVRRLVVGMLLPGLAVSAAVLITME